MTYDFDPPDPPQLCDHGENVYNYCEDCDYEKNDYDSIIKERKESEDY